MLYMHKPVKVDALQLKRPTTIQIDEENTMEGVAGDWLVISESGEQAVMDDAKFKKMYIPFVDKPVIPKEIIKIKKGVPLEKSFDDDDLRPAFTVTPSVAQQPEYNPSNNSIRDLLEETDDDVLYARLLKIQEKKNAEKQASQPQQQSPPKKRGFFASFGKKKTRRPSNDEFKGDNIQIV